MQYTHDAIIIGQGLAGTVLSETLADAGMRVMIFDKPLPGRASVIATGIVNPIVLRRTVASWRASEMLAIAGAFYRELELDYEASFWQPMPLVEIFPTAQEAGLWHLRTKEGELTRMISMGPSDDPGIAQFPQLFGCGLVRRSAWVDIPNLLTMHRERWMKAGALEEQQVQEKDVHLLPDGVEVHGRTAPVVIHCAGAFHDVRGLVPVRGEGLTLRLPGLELRSMVHRGLFLLPMAKDLFRAGSTFAWDNVWGGPTEEGRRSLLDKLARLWSGDVQVVEHWAGVRPGAKDRRPILGRTHERNLIFTGLGSRGALLAPWCAAHLADHLVHGKPLDPEVDLARFN